MHGADWTKMEEMYGQILPHVNHRADLNYLLDNMGAEIAVGHSYVRGGDMPDVPTGSRRPARRGLRDRERPLQDHAHLRQRKLESRAARAAARARRGRERRRLHPGDQRRRAARAGQHSSAARRHGEPSDAAHGQQQAGDGRRAAGARWCRSRASRALRTRAWVEENRRTVDKLSNGQLAYVYVPNTGQGGYPSFNRYYFSQQDKLGAIIDERYNGGGSAADYIIDVLQRDVRRLLQQRRRRSHAVHESVGRHLGAEGDDHQRDGRLGRRPDAVHVPLPQDRPARRQAHVGRAGAHRRHARASSTAAR